MASFGNVATASVSGKNCPRRWVRIKPMKTNRADAQRGTSAPGKLSVPAGGPFPFNSFDPFDPYFQFVSASPSGCCRSGYGPRDSRRQQLWIRIERMRKRIASKRRDGFVRMESGNSLVGNESNSSDIALHLPLPGTKTTRPRQPTIWLSGACPARLIYRAYAAHSSWSVAAASCARSDFSARSRS